MTRRVIRIKSRGMSIVECLVLMVILAVTVGALFTELAWSARSYSFARQDLTAREVLFNWVQTFESLWPNFYADPVDAFREATIVLNGTWDAGRRLGRVGGFTIAAVDKGHSSGTLKLGIKIYSGEDPTENFVELERSYNSFSNEVVSDDVLLQAEHGRGERG
ncbi:MAG: hypothetical protein LBT65_06040 [Synergistaceae bacterium]|jgi:hypothetical protein|nr:hypothetical protein [Synergistaceae bacterium]